MSKEDKRPVVDKDWPSGFGNPDNVIISESLISRVDPYNLGEIENVPKPTTECEFKFEDYALTGTVVGFSRVGDTTTYTFTTTPDQACLLINRSKLQSFAIAAGDTFTTGVDDTSTLGTFDFEVEVQNSFTATIIVSFTETS